MYLTYNVRLAPIKEAIESFTLRSYMLPSCVHLFTCKKYFIHDVCMYVISTYEIPYALSQLLIAVVMQRRFHVVLQHVEIL
jgi:hypothetical protein